MGLALARGIFFFKHCKLLKGRERKTNNKKSLQKLARENVLKRKSKKNSLHEIHAGKGGVRKEKLYVFFVSCVFWFPSGRSPEQSFMFFSLYWEIALTPLSADFTSHTHTEQRHLTEAYNNGMLTYATLSLPQVDSLDLGVGKSSSGYFRESSPFFSLLSCSFPPLPLSPSGEMRLDMADFPRFHSSALSSCPLVHPAECLSSPAACKKDLRYIYLIKTIINTEGGLIDNNVDSLVLHYKNTKVILL